MAERIQTDTVVVGGGIMGSATALHLRQLGQQVVLLERGFVASQASGASFGNIRLQGRHLLQLPLAWRSRRIWDRLEELVGTDCEFENCGNLQVSYSDEGMAALEDYARAAFDYDLEVEMLGRNAIRQRFPYLSEEVIGGSWTPQDAIANSRQVAPAFARAARHAGARIEEFCEVSELEHDGNHFIVSTKRGLEVRASAVVNCAGAWGAWIAERFGERAPISAEGPQLGVTEPMPYFLDTVLAVTGGEYSEDGKLKPSGAYLRQHPRGNIVFGGGDHSFPSMDPPRSRAIPETYSRLREPLSRLVPGLRSAQIIRFWSGIEGYLPDMSPIIGPSATTPGLFHAFGFCGHGFQLGPGVGAVMADLVAKGATDTPIDAFNISRFGAA
ncbi:MAG: FAD-binding oxidoreductase [Candidatus Latescibacteria bacterium]|jgi:sarcosine oxidase subunit beta|nr:FAD-binding oxidoreductase [Candidatus Latescibacterota bacterium]